MENYFITKIKNIIESYNKDALALRNQMQKNSEIYQMQEAHKLNKELQDKIESGYMKYTTELVNNFKEIREALSSSIYPTNESMSVEVQYFNENEYPVSPSPIMIMAFSDAHENNYLWQTFLYNWIDSLNEAEKNKYTQAIVLIEERLPKTKLLNYKRVFDAGLSMVNKIHNGTLTQLNLDYFLSEMQGFNDAFFEELGNGLEITELVKRIQSSHIPTRILTAFDDVKFDGEKIIEKIEL